MEVRLRLYDRTLGLRGNEVCMLCDQGDPIPEYRFPGLPTADARQFSVHLKCAEEAGWVPERTTPLVEVTSPVRYEHGWAVVSIREPQSSLDLRVIRVHELGGEPTCCGVHAIKDSRRQNVLAMLPGFGEFGDECPECPEPRRSGKMGRHISRVHHPVVQELRSAAREVKRQVVRDLGLHYVSASELWGGDDEGYYY